jgi:hypothetical protein
MNSKFQEHSLAGRVPPLFPSYPSESHSSDAMIGVQLNTMRTHSLAKQLPLQLLQKQLLPGPQLPSTLACLLWGTGQPLL